MKLERTRLPDVARLVPQVFGDQRGFFMETWNTQKLAEAGLSVRFVQENMSRSSKGVLRGLHYQIENAQGKLVRALRGRIFDVAVDLRRSSPTFGKWVGEWLDDEAKRALWVPPGFAHGFYVAEDADVMYACTEFYAPAHERSLAYDDPTIGIEWPLERGATPSLSGKDASAPTLSAAEVYP